ncbi:MAG: hypothetical protein NZ899_08920 [Thermoguttaceae bacterium]|nr:hypothetical protein [Thermoguttaceae bacterium]MDW8079915.1 hypothetical protein [Thermoguttaceae bacterium]
MKRLRMALLVAVVLVGAMGLGGVVVGQRTPVGLAWQSSPPIAGTSGAGLSAVATTVEGRYQQVVVIDPVQRALAVYHVKLDSGQIELKSVRNIHWDLQLIEFNGQRPLPQEIQSVVSGARQ